MSQSMIAAKKGHPKGLAVLFSTEMWERFNFYGMRTILTLFLSEALLMGDENASIIYGGYLGLGYLTPMLGGYISDKYLGNRNSILLGGTLMAIGQLILFTSASTFATNLDLSKTMMWTALLFVIFGNGFFKPNISSMVGQLYPKDQKSKLDSAFTIFYLGINMGAFLGQFICPFFGDVRNEVVAADGTATFVRDLGAFKWGFLAAAIAMIIGTVSFFFLKNKYVVTPDGKPVGGKPDKNEVHEDEATHAHFSNTSVAVLCITLVVTYFLFQYISWDPAKMPMNGSGLGAYFSALAVSPIKTFIYPFIYASAISLGIFILTDKSLTKVETHRILVLYIVAFFVIFFWAAFEQSGSSLTFIAARQTDTRIFGWTMPPSMVQIFNGVFVVIFAIPFSILWDKLQKRRLEPISTVKQAIGLALIGIGYFIIASQVKGLGTTGKIGVIWLIVLYLMHTWGELCLSPIGLSLVAKLAPKRFSSLLMGVWFIGNAAGYALTGTLGALLPPTGENYEKAAKAGIDLQGILDKKIVPTAEQLSILAEKKIAFTYPTFAGFTIESLYDFFMLFVILCGTAALMLYALTPLIKRMMHGVR
ncbi:peptide MFS transporter [Flavihumibacter solisilvae]|uniref:Amino acid transporter n=1 Tax=Flavihumibacter solisilvae TaxID=1349421 RepID=A0A0C1L4U9_9BACT|nr:peptide MFS transporter [Flavihumibacter solisilvae]KIC94566.1 amino acid transporter [Flavihumibacter solisilvae]